MDSVPKGKKILLKTARDQDLGLDRYKHRMGALACTNQQVLLLILAVVLWVC